MTYFEELCRAMTLLGVHEQSIFIGQAVGYPGTGMTNSLADVPKAKLLELPVFEDTQLGMAIGLSLAGKLPICIYPRINFLLLAIGQLVLHLDCLPRYSSWRPKIIIRTAVATPEPLDPGPQHLGDFTEPIRRMLKTVKVVKLETASQIVPAYQEAVAGEGSMLLVEQIARYGDTA